MLTIVGDKQRYCDGVSRRNFLKLGALATGGLALPELLRVEAAAGPRATRRSIINIYLGGGPTHMDTFDLKPNAPSEYRGEFQPIQTNVSGMEICELMPKLALQGDKLVIVRSIMDLRNEHSSRQTDSGWNDLSMRSMGGRPGIGAVVSKLHGTVNGTAPTSLSLGNSTRPGFLGPMYRDYQPSGDGLSNLRLNRAISEERLSTRGNLLGELDNLRRDADSSGMMEALDEFNQRAITVVTSGTLADALDVSKEDPRTAERYGFDRRGRFSGNKNFLLARRLVEAGVRVVSMNWGGWDTHGQNFNSMRQQLPALDVGLAALIEDLTHRGMIDDTLIMMSGEFGRTPRINGNAGRDHWPSAGFWLLGGGGLRTGQVIGATNAHGERPQERPLHLQQVYTTVYRQLGIDPDTQTLTDSNGRPQYLADHREPIEELV